MPVHVLHCALNSWGLHCRHVARSSTRPAHRSWLSAERPVVVVHHEGVCKHHPDHIASISMDGKLYTMQHCTARTLLATPLNISTGGKLYRMQHCSARRHVASTSASSAGKKINKTRRKQKPKAVAENTGTGWKVRKDGESTRALEHLSTWSV